MRTYVRFRVTWQGVMGAQPVTFARVWAWVH